MNNFKRLRKISNTIGISQVNMGKTAEGNGHVSVILRNGLSIRSEYGQGDFQKIWSAIHVWKKAQGLPFCYNGSSHGFVSRLRKKQPKRVRDV